ncbi:bifunctional phosphoribosylaminoimidazolecarboxamide formyltransferase/IMP cyclohydrolase [Bifidobacterium crudilactis]|uniref:bifunctional phosphoribosylaminoimidazolecarboxamide formyltransferase/IMP cyclohydrolase n=1 Tax=Bifidobacterium crudilactis TaxID=327277 RepID=UPI002352469E|nr:bifunctional phosphoribosylaminoimidazolecarboxamide formyltransferase/IMP cyclohydrolase [Bifidobacterium crudilactis]MCI2148369.1 bifunctional phosphoribosylaminoimidazolecarboxamide formyltransferase/IMP cyclohydrolase [Bifidobacterium crudilactis]MCI2157549.1 bifunctional phosphoribosylaminoimidazolecarboxamide formyltransferase/IMP cyclohydrolase [Bifidobacterium crudilactis]
MPNSTRPINRALVSVFHKEGIEALAAAFVKAGTQVVSTGSTAKVLSALGVQVTPVEEVTGFPESLEGRVKTLDPHIHAGILADMTNPEHVSQLETLGIAPFDLVVVNLYPFADTVRSGAADADVIEKIDIGGPSMVRGAAKNHASVAVITDPEDYGLVAQRVENGEGFDLEERRWLAAKAFAHTAAYDATIAQWTSSHWSRPDSLLSKDLPAPAFPTELTRTWDLSHTLRYGENPHQQAALYLDPLNRSGFAHAEQLGGKAMSYNNFVDADAAWRSVWDFTGTPAVAVVKHSNPCGLAIGADAAEAHRKAHACDPMSAYGGVIASNSEVSLQMAQQVKPIFTEVIVAPSYEDEALALLQTKKNLRILRVAHDPIARPQMRQIDGGLLIQSQDSIDADGDNPQNWKLVAGDAADEGQLQDLVFAWKAVRSVKSNAILIAHDGATVGIGMGQVNRVDSSHLAVTRANTLADGANRTQGAVAASDAFFPFPDGMEILADAGVKAVVQPGGSIRDEAVFAAAEQAGVTMYVTGARHFFH